MLECGAGEDGTTLTERSTNITVPLITNVSLNVTPLLCSLNQIKYFTEQYIRITRSYINGSTEYLGAGYLDSILQNVDNTTHLNDHFISPIINNKTSSHGVGYPDREFVNGSPYQDSYLHGSHLINGTTTLVVNTIQGNSFEKFPDNQSVFFEGNFIAVAPYLILLCIFGLLIMAACLETLRRACRQKNNILSCAVSSENIQNTSYEVEKPSKTQDWVRPLGKMETLMIVGGLYGSMNTVQAMWLSSRFPITNDHMVKALDQLAKRVPQLQMCIGRRGIKLWFRKMKSFQINFETSTEDPMIVYQQLVGMVYNMWTGPLWKVKLVVLPREDCLASSKVNYRYVIIFSVQHVITDGTTNMLLCREVVSILNAILEGTSIPVLTHPVIPPLSDSLLPSVAASFLIKYFCKKTYSALMTDFSLKTSFMGIFPRPATKIKETRILRDEISPELTKNLIGNCRKEKVTVHSCIVTAANLAWFRVAQIRSHNNLETAKLYVTNCVNMRRYYPAGDQNASGCHISLEELQIRVSSNDLINFWSQAQQINQTLKKHLNEDDLPAKVVQLLPFASIIYPINYYLTKRGKRNWTDCHYITTNMGNLKEMLPHQEGNMPIEITNLLRSVSCESAGNPCMLTFHTFRDRFMISMDYYTNKIDEEVARDFFTTLTKYIINLANTGNILPV